MALTDGAARERIAAQDLAALRGAGVLIEDPRRERPRYFDGRFLAARDLIRDQQYFLTREADLGQAAGSGVALGLFVRQGTEAQSLAISPGHGVTPAGELVLLPRQVVVSLANIPAAEQLSARFGLSRLPQPPMRSRTGLFVLGLRPVEFTANPIGAYPTSITGQRTVEDGDVVEGTAIILVPWRDDGAADALEARRGRAAHDIFVGGSERGVSASVLPLAMVALQNNTVVWIDEPMVRRELGADRADLPGLGFSPRALRLAYFLQHQTHLADVVRLAGSRSFPAASRFSALPSAGRLPPGAINAADFTQSYFPAEIDADFSIIPEDELPALIEDALALPPIDLTLPGEALDSTAVAILAPVPRNEWRAVSTRLTTRVRPLRPAALNLVAQRKPLESLLRLRPLRARHSTPRSGRSIGRRVAAAGPAAEPLVRAAPSARLSRRSRRRGAALRGGGGRHRRRPRARAPRGTGTGDESRSRPHGGITGGDRGGHAASRFTALRRLAGADGGGARRAQRARRIGRRHRHGSGGCRHLEPDRGGSR